MTRFSLLLATMCAVQVLAISRVKRATAGGNAETAANITGGTGSPGSTGGNSHAATNVSSPAPAQARRAFAMRRGFEYKPDPKDLMKPSGKRRETSSSSGEKDDKKADDNGGGDKESMAMTVSDEESSTDDKKGKTKYVPKSTEERHGWKKWHRKCYKCPEEMRMKWRDPRVKWVCGAYQRARRSFKSLCMMRYRNCQDGTMFVPIHEHRCANSSPDDSAPHGEHFMYDYKVALSDDTSGSKKGESSSSEQESSKSSSE